MDDWISVKDSLPEEKKVVPVYHIKYGFCVGSYGWGKSKVWHIQPFKKGWIIPFPEQATHWLPHDLPKVEPELPRCPRCNIVLTFIVVNKSTTSHTYWECPRCGKETYPIEETKIRGESTEQPKPFQVEECAGFYPRCQVVHRIWGHVMTFPDRRAAQVLCVKLNEAWQLGENSR